MGLVVQLVSMPACHPAVLRDGFESRPDRISHPPGDGFLRLLPYLTQCRPVIHGLAGTGLSPVQTRLERFSAIYHTYLPIKHALRLHPP
jgi:hypothetical protein